MEPIPETRQVLEHLARIGDAGPHESLGRLAGVARERVPGLVGLSISLLTEGVVLTYVSTDAQTGALDGVQYVDDGPCLESVRSDAIVHCETQALLDEEVWRLFAQAGAAAGVASSLSLPVHRDGQVTGGVNLYGARPHTFDGHVDELAMLFGAWAPGAVANADLSFGTRWEAMQAPRRLHEQEVVDRATGVLAALHVVELEQAEQRLHRAAARAGITPFDLARALVHTFDASA